MDADELWDDILGNKAVFQINYPLKWTPQLLDSVMAIFLLVASMRSLFPSDVANGIHT